jgi:hypothetical protein
LPQAVYVGENADGPSAVGVGLRVFGGQCLFGHRYAFLYYIIANVSLV